MMTFLKRIIHESVRNWRSKSKNVKNNSLLETGLKLNNTI